MNFISILQWYRQEKRPLPWRMSAVTPWQILVSEVMLQQTPVKRVLPIWTEWISKWPTPQATAIESPAQLLRVWGKLGYPRRATRLHACATVITEQYSGQVPRDIATLQQLPGIGSYTAHAIACFGYHQPVPVVDTNVRRVVARMVHGNNQASSPSIRRDNTDVSKLFPPDAFTEDIVEFSGALMELGALICTAKKPQCSRCPVITCQWRIAGYPLTTSPIRPSQRYIGTDRYVRGRLLDILRNSPGPVSAQQLRTAWQDDLCQQERALQSLITDQLIIPIGDNLFCLPGDQISHPS